MVGFLQNESLPSTKEEAGGWEEHRKPFFDPKLEAGVDTGGGKSVALNVALELLYVMGRKWVVFRRTFRKCCPIV